MPKKRQGYSYSDSGVNYTTLDATKQAALRAAKHTAQYLHGKEIESSRGESAYVWQQGDVYMASVIEGLGTKNLVADEMIKITGKTYYDRIAHDTVATIINDLATVGARPLTLHAYWATGDSTWLADKKRTQDLIRGWKNACDIAGVTWAGGETPTLKNIIMPNAIDLGGSAVGIIQKKQWLLSDEKLREGDRILFLRSTGVNANGLSLARTIAKKLPRGYATKLSNGKMYGETLLNKSNIYSRLVSALLTANINLHYIANITGHGLRKIMRGRPSFSYVIESLFAPQSIFQFLQKESGMDNTGMYSTFNMGQDYAIFLPKNQVQFAQKIVKKCGFASLDAGYVERGKKEVILEQKNIVYEEKTLQVR